MTNMDLRLKCLENFRANLKKQKLKKSSAWRSAIKK